MVKIRLKRVGKKKKPFYHVVVADSRKARDGKIIEKIGTYDPMPKPSIVEIDVEKADQWIKNGARPTDTAKKLIEIAKGEKTFVEKKKEVKEEIPGVAEEVKEIEDENVEEVKETETTEESEETKEEPEEEKTEE